MTIPQEETGGVMKIRNAVLIIFLCIFSLTTHSVYSQSLKEILAGTKQSMLALKQVKTKGKTIAGSDITHSEGVTDYVNKSSFVIERKGLKISSAFYLKDNIIYTYTGVVNSWLKIQDNSNLAGDILNKDRLFSFFPDNPEDKGFDMKLLGEEIVENELCYITQSKPVSMKKAKKFIGSSLEQFVSSLDESSLTADKDLLVDYMNSYVQNSEHTLWISKKTFFVIKILRKYHQMVGPKKSIPVEQEIICYDFNKPLTINIPNEAQSASWMPTPDMLLNK